MKCVVFLVFRPTLKWHISPCPLLLKALFPLESKHSGVFNRPSFVLLSQIKCCSAPAVISKFVFCLCQHLALADLGVCMDAPVSQLSSPLLATEGRTVDVWRLKSVVRRVLDVSTSVIGSSGNEGKGGVE